MKLLKLLLITTALLLSSSLNASQRDATFNMYGVNAKTDKNQNSFYGGGLAIDSEEFKGKIELTEDFFKTGLMYKFNPLADYYVKVGANYINQKMYAIDNSNARVNQYSGALALGYMLSDTLYAEIGGATTQLNGTKIGADYEVKDETTSLAYLELAARIGDFDFTANAGEVYYEFKQDEFSYGVGADYYLGKAKLGFNHQNEKNNISNTYSLEYGYLFLEGVDNHSADTYQVNAGARIAFIDITDFSTYEMPNNGKRHLSELHRFEGVVNNNMNIQSSGGVSKTAEAVARDAISAPTIAMTDQTVNDNAGAVATTLAASTETGVVAGAVYSIVANPTGGKLTIDANTGTMIWDGNGPNGGADYTIVKKVTNPDGGNSSTTFNLHVNDNA